MKTLHKTLIMMTLIVFIFSCAQEKDKEVLDKVFFGAETPCLTKSIEYSNGEKRVYTYNGKGLKVSEMYYRSNGQKASEISYQYTDDGQLESDHITGYNKNNTIWATEKKTYSYNGGKLLFSFRETRFTGGDTYFGTEEHLYSPQGLRSETLRYQRISTQAEMQLLSKTLYRYSGSKLTKENNYAPDGNLASFVNYVYHSDGKTVSFSEQFDAAGRKTASTSNDTKGNALTVSYYTIVDGNSKLRVEHLYTNTYDNNGISFTFRKTNGYQDANGEYKDYPVKTEEMSWRYVYECL